jgi:hypothetical protein
MFCSLGKLFSIGIAIASIGVGEIVNAQQISVVPLSSSAAVSNYAVSPQADGVTFVGDAEVENQFLVVIDGDAASASLLTMGPDGALLLPGSAGPFALASPIIKLRDDEYSVSFVAIPAAAKGTAAEGTATQQWAASNSAWAAGRFGWGWQDSLGEWLAANVLIPVVGVENLAGASDTTLVTGTVIVSIPIAVGMVVGGEVLFGVGTYSATLTTATTATTGTVTTAAAEAEATRRYINLVHNVVKKTGELPKRIDPTDFDL